MFMWGFLKFLILAPVAALLVLFAVGNRQPVTLTFDPVVVSGAFSITVPFFVVFFAILVLGLIIGYIASWWAQGVHRKAERHLRRECDRLTGECHTLKEQLPATQAALLLSR